MPVGLFLVLAYNLELARRTFPLRPLVRARLGRLPGDLRLRGVAGEIGVAAVLAAAFGRAALARAAHALEPRPLRPPAGARVSGELELRDGSRETLDADRLIVAEERGLRLLAATLVVLAAALVAFRI